MTPAVQQVLTEYRGKKRVTVLASGDPMLHGVGVPLTRDLVATEFRVIPQVSAFSLACARLGWPMAETTLITLVNRPVEQLLGHLYPGQRLVIYSEDGSTPATEWIRVTSRASAGVSVQLSLSRPRESCAAAAALVAARAPRDRRVRERPALDSPAAAESAWAVLDLALG